MRGLGSLSTKYFRKQYPVSSNNSQDPQGYKMPRAKAATMWWKKEQQRLQPWSLLKSISRSPHWNGRRISIWSGLWIQCAAVLDMLQPQGKKLQLIMIPLMKSCRSTHRCLQQEKVVLCSANSRVDSMEVQWKGSSNTVERRGVAGGVCVLFDFSVSPCSIWHFFCIQRVRQYVFKSSILFVFWRQILDATS